MRSAFSFGRLAFRHPYLHSFASPSRLHTCGATQRALVRVRAGSNRQWRGWGRQARSKTLMAAAAQGALGTASFVQLAEEENAREESTAELRMLEVSREEIKKKIDDDDRGLSRMRHKIVLFLDL